MGRGSSGLKANGNSSGNVTFVGKRVTDISLTFDTVERTFGLKDLTAAQKNTLLDMFRGMAQNDRSYDAEKTPYEIQHISIKQPLLDNLLPDMGENTTVQVSITTGGNTGRSYVDSLDHRYRSFLLGKKGGTYTYSKNGKRKAVSAFDIMRGTLEP